VRGPAGSGKTNILLLRAKWFKMKALSNFKIISFTASLRDFIRTGCVQYKITPNAAVTCVQFLRELLDEYGIDFESSGNFETDRAVLAGKAKSLVEAKKIPAIYDAILVDECQDYMDTELLVLRQLAKRLVLVADSRQAIYRATHTADLLEQLVDNNVISLKYHYRSGLKLCIVADAILRDSANFAPVHKECRYEEDKRPSSVSVTECPTFADQIQAILDRLPSQLALYPNEQIGVLFPKREQTLAFQDALKVNTTISDKARVRVETIHGAKGWEFRAVHVAGCEALYKMGPMQKRLAYTAVLRGRTSVSIYFSGSLPGYLESALAQLEPPKADPGLGELFTG
jgi:DNA helicase IV